MSIQKEIIKRLILEELQLFLLEQEEMPVPEEPVEDTPTEITDEEPAADIDAEVPTAAITDDEAIGAEPDIEGAPEVAGDEPGADLDIGDVGAGGGFVPSPSLGADLSPATEPGLDLTPEEEPKVVAEPQKIEIPEDPIASITDNIVSLSATTKKPAAISSAAKGLIQKYFDDYEDATPLIKNLWDTEDLVLRDVARRLLLFIRGE